MCDVCIYDTLYMCIIIPGFSLLLNKLRELLEFNTRLNSFKFKSASILLSNFLNY